VRRGVSELQDRIEAEALRRAQPAIARAPAPPEPFLSGTATYGALDLGTNNCRLLIARPTAGGFRVVDAFSRIVRLGEGLTPGGRIASAAMQRTLSALEVCAGKLRRRGVTRLRAVATEACRRAENGRDFLTAARVRCGLELEVIDAEEEAGLALYGCAPLLDPAHRDAAIIDIGGGSTEVCWLRGAPDGDPERLPRLLAWHSLPLGVVDLAERFGGHEVDRTIYDAMVAEVLAGLRPFVERTGLSRLAEAGELQMIGTSGTVTTLTGIHRGLPRYDRSQVDGAVLPMSVVRSVSERVRAMGYAARVAHPCIGSDRADLVVAGCAILEAYCRLCPTQSLTVADRGLREGLLYLMMREDGVWAPPESRDGA
jgi:exopolyphosphatase/guanosine-5'-triphosphate,3'-diphosphate pyrophosphatase